MKNLSNSQEYAFCVNRTCLIFINTTYTCILKVVLHTSFAKKNLTDFEVVETRETET